MLTELKRLTIDADGRYATDSELQFLKDYIDSVEDRAALYEKIASLSDTLDEQLDRTLKTIDPNIYKRGNRDVSAVCQRDRRHALRCLTIAMLLDDLERLKNDYLTWDQKIVKCFNDRRGVTITYQVMIKALESLLQPREKDLFMPAVQLAKTTLTA